MSDELPQSTEQAPIAETGSEPAASPQPSSEDQIRAEMGAVYDAKRPETDDLESGDEKPSEPSPQIKQPEAIKPPASFNAKAREHWNSLPREMQEYIFQRETEAQRKISELGNVSASIRPHLQHVERIASESGLTTGDTIQRFVAADQFIKSNPEGAIRYLAQAHNVDLGKFGGDPRQHQQQQQAREIQMAQQAYDYLQTQHAQSLTQTIEKFAADKAEHWKDIEPSIAYHATAIRVSEPDLTPREVLKEAYERALKDNPQIAANLPSAREKAAKEKEAQTRRAQEAKRVASMNVGSRSTGKTASVRKDLYSEMADIYDRVNAGG